MATLEERIRGGIYGLLVGDACGVPYEFNPPDRIPAYDLIDMTPPRNFRRAHGSVAVGTWSDDGAQALCLLASLLHNDGLDVEDLGRRLLNWYQDGYMAVGGHVFDVGIQTSQALSFIARGISAKESGPSDERANGNGSLMRVLPLALWHTGSDEELVELAHLQSLPTHRHARSQVCCALYCLWARALLRGDGDWSSAVTRLRAIYPQGSTERAELESHVKPDDETPGKGSGYVVDCLRSARDVMRFPGYADVVKHAIALGNDTDTTACVAGGLAGVREGISAIPRAWLAALKEKELVEPLVEKLVQRRR